ncbi:Nephrocystin-3 [Talaromyces pinophilus]|nr:Nephrocystin-3 [Talaromyces pinophilus]
MLGISRPTITITILWASYRFSTAIELSVLTCCTERPETPPSPSLLIPFRRDPHFVDRGTILNQLHDQRAAQEFCTALVGLGGVGCVKAYKLRLSQLTWYRKSQLAIEYAYQIHEREPETWVFWIHASNADRFKQSYLEIAETVKLFGRRDPRANIFMLVYNWLQNSKNGKWVLILDNIDETHFLLDHHNIWNQAGHGNRSASQPLQQYLPRKQNGSILITSRTREAPLELVDDRRGIITIDPMVDTDAQTLFRKKLGDDGNSEDIAELAAALEFIPLAIVQAAAYISDPDRGCSIRQYLNEFKKNDRKKIRLLEKKEGQGLFRRDWEAENSVLVTWQISFDSIRQTRRSAANLLSLMSFFDRQGIPEALLRDHSRQRNAELNDGNDADDSKSQSSVTDEFEDDKLLLQRYSLISVNVDRTSFNMHNLVQLATRGWLKKNGELEKWKRQYILNLNAEFPTGEYENWAQCQVLFPHAKSAVRQEPQERDSLIQWAAVLYKAAWYDLEKSNGAEGEKLSVRAMEARKELLGLENEHTLASMRMVGSIYLLRGRWKEAEELFMQVIETSKRVLVVEHPDMLTCMANLASTYRSQGRWKEAEALFVQVMKIRKSALDVEHPNTLASMSNLASTYWDQGRWKEAEELFMQVIKTSKRALGVEYPSTLTSIANLASTYRSQGRWKEAEELFVQVIKTSKRVLGVEHPDTLASITSLASTYRSQGRWKEAEALEVQVIETTKRVLGVEHPSTLTSIANLASTYWDQGRWKEAEELLVQVIETMKRVLGVQHPDTLTSMANLASTYRIQGRWKEAEELFVQVIETSRRVLGVEYPDTLASMNNLASTYWNQSRWTEAEDLFVQVMETRKRVLGAEHPSTLTTMANLASTYRSQGRWKEAVELLVQVIETMKRVLGVQHPDTLTSMANLAFTLRKQDYGAEAINLMKDFRLCISTVKDSRH